MQYDLLTNHLYLLLLFFLHLHPSHAGSGNARAAGVEVYDTPFTDVNDDEGIYVEDNKITVGEWAKTWLEVYKKGFKSNTYNYYKYSLSAHAGEIKDIYLKDLKQAHLQKIINQLISKGNVRSAEIFKSTVSQMLEKAVENELLSKNVAKKNSTTPQTEKSKTSFIR